MPDHTYTPKVVRDLAAELHQATGQPPEVTRVDVRRWRLTMANDRVRMTVDHKLTGPGRCVWAGSVLTVDGVRQRLAANVDHFARIFRDPDNELHRRSPEPPPLAEPIPPRRVEDAPAAVRKAHQRLVDRLPTGTDVQVSQPTELFWIIQVTTDRATMRINYRHHDTASCTRRSCRQPAWDVDRRHPIQLCVDGEDHTDQVEGNIERALSLFFRPDGPAGQTSPPVTAQRGPARSNAVETRRATVMRT